MNQPTYSGKEIILGQLIEQLLNVLEGRVFVESCIAAMLEQSVETNASVFADKEEFTPEELELMHDCSLSDISYSTWAADPTKFKIQISAQKYLLFSNRTSISQIEARGEVLRQALDKLTKLAPHMSLYAALTKIARDPDLMVKYFLAAPIFTMKLDLTHLSPKEQQEMKSQMDIRQKILTTLSLVGINYLLIRKSQGTKKIKKLAKKLGDIVDRNKSYIINTLLKNGEEVKHTLEWIERVQDLSQKFPVVVKEITQVVRLAQAVLNEYVFFAVVSRSYKQKLKDFTKAIATLEKSIKKLEAKESLELRGHIEEQERGISSGVELSKLMHQEQENRYDGALTLLGSWKNSFKGIVKSVANPLPAWSSREKSKEKVERQFPPILLRPPQ